MKRTTLLVSVVTLCLVFRASGTMLESDPGEESYQQKLESMLSEHQLGARMDEVLGSNSIADLPILGLWPDQRTFVFLAKNVTTGEWSQQVAADEQFNDEGWRVSALRGSILADGLAFTIEFAADDHPSMNGAVEYVIAIGYRALVFFRPGEPSCDIAAVGGSQDMDVSIPYGFYSIDQNSIDITIPRQILESIGLDLEALAYHPIQLEVQYTTVPRATVKCLGTSALPAPHNISGDTPLLTNAASAYRGVNVLLELIDEGGLDILASDWNVNLIRVMLGALRRCGTVRALDESRSCCVEDDLEKLDWLIEECEELGIRVIICVSQFPGHIHLGDESDDRLWTDVQLQESLVDFWKTIAARYSSRGDVIYGYDLLGEPWARSTSIDAPPIWLDLAARVTRGIREVDATHSIVVECPVWANPEGFDLLEPLADDNVVYSFHLYQPLELTNEAVWEQYAGLEYPSEIWDKDYLRGILHPVREFQLQYDVPILAGEFGISSSVPPDGREAYLNDAMDLFEEYGFDYAYWSYREIGIWSLEHVGQPVPWGTGMIPRYVGDTGALQIFKEFLELNEKVSALERRHSLDSCIFDESHWDFSQPTNAMSLDLAWRLDSSFEVNYHLEGKIDGLLLLDAALLVTGTPYRRYSSSEIEAIHEFVSNGGALIFYADALLTSTSLSVNELLVPFGIRYIPSVLASEIRAWTGGDTYSFFSSVFASPFGLSVTNGAYYFNWTASLEVSAPAETLVFAGQEAWMDHNKNGSRELTEPMGPFPVIAVAKYGDGRVAVIADQASGACNMRVWMEIVQWLSQPE